MNPSLPFRTALATGSCALLALTAGALPSQAGPAPASSEPDATGTVVASGLNAPRHLSFARNGDLYIAESGAPGGAELACVDHPELGEACVTDSGSVTELSRKGVQQRVLTGLPALVAGGEAVGPTDVVLHGKSLFVTIGLGGNAELRSFLGPEGAVMGTLREYPLVGKRAPTTIADLVAHEEGDPDGEGPDSNPVDLVRDRNGWLVTDAGGNTVVRAAQNRTTTMSVLPISMTEVPPDLGLPPGTMMPVQSVPTATAQGPDGAWYVAELNGFPFPAGGSTVWRLDRAGTPQAWATGLSNVVDLAWDGDDLYAVQMVLTEDLVGSLVKVDAGGDHEVVGGPWFAPYGVAVDDDEAYVTTCSVCPGAGEVVKVELD